MGRAAQRMEQGFHVGGAQHRCCSSVVRRWRACRSILRLETGVSGTVVPGRDRYDHGVEGLDWLLLARSEKVGSGVMSCAKVALIVGHVGDQVTHWYT